MLGKDCDRRGITEPSEEFCDGVRLSRKLQVRPDVVQRREDEAAQVKARVGEDERGVVQREIAHIKNIKIERARRIARMAHRTPECRLDSAESRKQ